MVLHPYNYNSYYAEDNETPKIIAVKLGLDVKDLVAINKIEYKGFQQHSKLMTRTKLIVPYDGSSKKRKRSTILVPADEMAAVFKTLKKLDSERYFALPVTDEIAPLYSKIILTPMDFLTMRKRFEAGEYADFAALREDFSLVCRNAVIYNEPESEFSAIARNMFEEGMALLDEVAIRFGGQGASSTFARATKKKAGTASTNSTKLRFWPNSKRHHALPRLAEAAGGGLRQVPPFSVKEVDANGCSPVTDLHYSSGMSFGPSYDSMRANQDARSGSSLAYGVDRTPSEWRTDHGKVASFSYLQHAASVIGTVRRLQTPIADLWAQNEALSAANTLPSALKRAAGADDSVASVDACSGTSGAGAAAGAAAGAGAGAAPPATPLAASGVPPLAPPPDDESAANASTIQQLIKLRTARMGSQKPWLVTEAECHGAARMRRNLLALIKSSAEGPGGLITDEYVRELIGADEFDPK
eukprot:gene1020-7725_t